MCCSVLHCVAVCCSCVCCSVLQCVAVCCSVLQCVAVCRSVPQCVAVCRSASQCVAVCRSVLQCVAVCCNVLHGRLKNVSTHNPNSAGRRRRRISGCQLLPLLLICLLTTLHTHRRVGNRDNATCLCVTRGVPDIGRDPPCDRGGWGWGGREGGGA